MTHPDEIAAVRRMVPDKAGPDQMFDDLEIEAYLGDNDGNVKLAVASIWEALAGNHLLTFKANVRADDGHVTSHQQSALFLERAAALRKEALEEIEGAWSLVGGERC